MEDPVFPCVGRVERVPDARATVDRRCEGLIALHIRRGGLDAAVKHFNMLLAVDHLGAEGVLLVGVCVFAAGLSLTPLCQVVCEISVELEQHHPGVAVACVMSTGSRQEQKQKGRRKEKMTAMSPKKERKKNRKVASMSPKIKESDIDVTNESKKTKNEKKKEK